MFTPRQTCVVCGEGFWRVRTEAPTGRLRDLVCIECTVVIDNGPVEAVLARNQLAPWWRETDRGRMVFHPQVEVYPDPASTRTPPAQRCRDHRVAR